MPKQTNSFQTLVYRLEQMLNPSNVTVTESKMVRSRIGGPPTEIDVAIEGEIGGRSFLWAIECRDHKRAQHVGWIRELSGKYQDLPVEKTIAVSRTGFSKPAYDLAAQRGIEAITLEEAENVNWAGTVLDASAFVLEYVAPVISHIQVLAPAGDRPPQEFFDTIICDNNGQRLGSVANVCHKIITEEESVKESLSQLKKGLTPEPIFLIPIETQGVTWSDNSGSTHKVHGIKIRVGFRKYSSPLPGAAFRYGSYRGYQGKTAIRGRPIQALLVEDASGSIAVRIFE